MWHFGDLRAGGRGSGGAADEGVLIGVATGHAPCLGDASTQAGF